MWKSARSRVLATMAFSQPATIFGKKLSGESQVSSASGSNISSTRGLANIFGPKTAMCLMVMLHVSVYRFDDALPGEGARQPGETQLKPQVKETGASASQLGLKSAIKKNTGETKRVKVGVRTDEGIEGTQPALSKTKPRLKFEGDDEADIPADGALPFCSRPSSDDF